MLYRRMHMRDGWSRQPTRRGQLPQLTFPKRPSPYLPPAQISNKLDAAQTQFVGSATMSSAVCYLRYKYLVQ